MSTVDSSGNIHRGAGAPGGGQFAGKVNTAPGALLTDEVGLTTQTPIDIDEQLAELYYEAMVHGAKEQQLRSEITRYERYIQRESRFPGLVADYQRAIDRYTVEADEHTRARAELRDREVPFHDEFARRGGWPRAFLVSGGHLHSSMNCSTCNRDGKLTRFAWMTDYSGASETEIVEAAGERACTTCFPTAPVDVLNRKSTLMTPDEKEATEQRAARDAERARKAEEKAAKAITNPDGTELREPRQYGQVIRTLVTAERELVDVITVYELADSRTRYLPNRDMVAEQLHWRDVLVEAIAAKKDITPEQVREEALVKAEKKYRRDWGS